MSRKLEKIEKLRNFLGEVMVYYVVIVGFFVMPLLIFMCPVAQLLLGDLPAQFIGRFAAGVLLFFLFVCFVALLACASLTAVKLLFTGFSREELDFLKDTLLLTLVCAVFFIKDTPLLVLACTVLFIMFIDWLFTPK